MKQVLVVEDNEDLAMLNCKALENKGYLAVSALTGKKALALLETFLPNVIVMDLNLPDTSAEELVKCVREMPSHKNTPIILASGRDDIDNWGQKFECSKVLQKPFAINSLVKAVDELC